MEPRPEKADQEGKGPKTTPNREVHGPKEITARMHFYAVHNTGEQLRRAVPSRTGKKPDRMEGR